MKLSSKQYLVDITLKTLQIKPTKQSSKVTCEVHFGDNYLRIKFQPLLTNGIANFIQQRIRIPYTSQIALVFKMIKPDKKQVFLGHLPLELENYLKDDTFFIEIKDQSLQETDAKVCFDCRIIDKALFELESQDMDIADDDILSPTRKQTDPSVQLHNKLHHLNRKALSIKHHSEIERNNKNFVTMKKNPSYNLLLNDEFFAELQKVSQIMSKKETFVGRKNIIAMYQRDEEGFLRSDKILELQNKLLKIRDEERVGSFLIYSLIAGVTFVLGFMAA